MKSIRLNKTLRAEILANIEVAYIEANPTPHVTGALKNLLANVEVTYRGQAQVLMDIFRKNAAERYICKLSDIYITVNGSTCTTRLKDSDGNVETLVDLNPEGHFRVYDKESVEPEYIQYLADKKVQRKQEADVATWKLQLTNYLRDVGHVLDGVNTTEQLLTVWPEAEGFLPSGIVNPSRIQLPAISIANLNAKLS